ncbi:hypothetical protein AWC38_SpisGene22465 [Stylophora pistillata]|uniref:CARD domain-containing protein n=1 Tax=Stylophora pistillata TaxID=50429 RepID=A0A2B4R534_STYPI|nr:hypothetical protein AWC38_SpisGene22465 [Stylophora pistillata]
MATEGAREKPLSDKHRQILNRVKPDLLKDMDPDEVLLHMAADDVFTQSEEEKIQAQPTRWEKCKELLKILPRKGTKAYRIFRKVLQSAHPHLANSISERDNTRLGGEENSKQADRPRRAPDSRKFLDLLYCLPKEGEGMLTHLASQRRNRPKIVSGADLNNGDGRWFGEGKEDAGTCWQDFGVVLELPEAELDNIDKDFKFAKEKGFAVLKSWRNNKAKKATVGCLFDAFESIGQRRVAENFFGT